MDFKDDQKLDNQLADFVDALMEGEDPTIDESNEDLRELEETTRLLWETFAQDTPDQAMSQRVWENLDLEWQEKEQERPKVIPFTQRLRESRSVFAAAAAVMVLVLAAVFIITGGDAQVAGSAIGSGNVVIPLALLALIGIALLVYSQKEK